MATIQRRGKSWFAQVCKKGVRKSQSFTTKGQASAWATQLEAEILSGSYYSGSEKTFADAVDRYIEEVTPTKKSADEETYILKMLKKNSFANLKIGDITTAMIAQYRDTELKRVKPASVLRYILAISMIFEQARREWQWVTQNPVKDVKKPSHGQSRDRIFTDNEIERILNELHHNDTSTFIQQAIGDVFLFALETAMRASEMLNLKWDDIDLERRFLRLHDTKNKDKRNVALSTRAIEILNARREFDRPFKLKSRTLANMFKIYCIRAGITDARFHDTRHTSITKLARKLSPFELARNVGHKQMNQTLKYFNETAEEIANKLD